MRKYRSSILLSLLMLVLCASIIVGSTLAYFTDEVSTTGNVITSGTLDASLYWADQLPTEENGVTWQDASNVTLFDNEYWEPNATVVKYIRIDNTGKLAFQYELNVLPTLVSEGGANLMDVIDVYYDVVDETTPAITRSNFATELQHVGVMSNLLTNEHGASFGVLLPKGANGGELPQGVTASEGSVTACMVLHMQETAGNEYQGLSAGDGFNLQLFATQYTYEKDAFGNQYDAEATLPNVTYSVEIVQPVTADANGFVASDVHFTSSNGISATVPAGAKLEDGVTQLKLVVHPKAASANVQLTENDVLSAYEVRVEGLAKDNTVPVLIDLGEVLAKGLNIGNYSLYHVENGATNPMTLVNELTASSAHNSFTYDPATGEVSLAMATFSEVALVTDTENAWKGEFDYTWYTDVQPLTDGVTANYIIANADQLAAFGAIVGGMDRQTKNDFENATVTLIADINLGDDEEHNNSKIIFYPIGYCNSTGSYEKVTGGSVTSNPNPFKGTFDGNGHTISNFYQNTWEMFGDYNDGYSGTPNHYKDGMGLFGYVYGGTIKNLTVDSFSSDGEFTPTGVIAAYAANSTFENIAITNCNPRVYNTGNGGIVGIGGNTDDSSGMKLTFTNITVDNTNKISALWGSWDVACGGLMGMFRGNSSVNFTNCHVAAQIDVFNDVCGNYQYYWYRYSGMMIGSIRKNKTENGYIVPDTAGISFVNCSATYGEWADYFYCEFTENSQASYTEDYQFSRVPPSELMKSGDEIKCNHNHKEVEDKRAVLLPFNQLFNGNGYGVKAISEFDGVTVKHQDDTGALRESEEKFGYIATDTLEANKSYKIEDLFEHIENKPNVSSASVIVAITDLDHSDGIVSANYIVNNEMGWGENTITFSGTGEVELIIQDYYFCTPTVVRVSITDRQPVDKFVAKENLEFVHTTQGGTVEKTLGDIFEAKEGVSIQSQNVVVTVADERNCWYTKNESDWEQSTVSFRGTGIVSITITDNDYCKETTAEIKITEPDPVKKFETKFTGDFLYRVGNKNTVKLDSLFKAKEGATIGTVSVTVEAVEDTSASGTYTSNATDWEKGTIQFNGTGVVKVTIQDYNFCTPTELYLEVVDAYNRTTAYFEYNSVLLNDVAPSNTISTSGIIYGNGFTVNMENAPISEKNGAVFHLYDGAILKNLKIVGKEFTTVAMNVNDTNYGVSAVRAWGTVTIENCYISGCRAPVSVTGTELTIKDSVIANGVYANIDFRSGILNLHNVTTVNEPHTVNGTTILGLGIVGNMTASAGRQLNITGTLTQYNWVSKVDCQNIKASGVSSIYNSVFTDEKYAALRYEYNGTTYVNTGILSLCSDFGNDAVSGAPDNYNALDVTATISNVTIDGCVWSPGESGTLTAADMAYHDKTYEWVSTDQGTSYVPGAFDFSDAGITAENGVAQIEYENGSSYTLSVEKLNILFAPTKYGQPLEFKVTMKGEDYTRKSIVFDDTTSQDYEITYSVTDNLVYDKNGNHTEKTYEIVKNLKVFATVIDKKADPPNFTFYYGTNGKASAGTPHTTQPTDFYTSTIKQVGEAYYIMPNVSATTANAIGSQTVDGETVYYPIVDGINVRSGNRFDYDFTRYYPIFKAVKISDNGTEYMYSDTKEMPATVAWVSATIDSGNGASALNDGFGLYNNQYLCKIQTKAGDAESGGTSVVKFSYTAIDGNTYYYYVGYRFYDEDEGSVCVTPDTLVTLADGTKKEIQYVTIGEEVLAWNFYSGAFETLPVSLLQPHHTGELDILHLIFDDGTVLKVVGEHGIFDAKKKTFVFIDIDDVEQYLGCTFLKHAGDSFAEVKLVDYKVETEFTTAYTILSTDHYNVLLEDLLTVTPAHVGDNFFNPFEINDSMKYDEAAMQADIEKYGLYTYEDFDHVLTAEQFDALNLGHFKVSVGKGLVTYDGLIYLIETFINGEF